MKPALKNFLKNNFPKSMIRALYPYTLGRQAKQGGITLDISSGRIDVRRGSDILRISKAHALHLGEIISEFDHFFSAVVPRSDGPVRLVDYSTPRYHDVVGFGHYPIIFPSFAEPLATTRHYIDFAQLREGMCVLDLGAYSGLTSILFSQAMGKTGLVVAVEADLNNIECLKTNLLNFAKYSENRIALLEAAVWSDNHGIEFSSEGNMGASAVAIVGGNRGRVSRIPSYTLSGIAEKFALKKVDFIKCDVEGAEKELFKDQDFLMRFKPRIVIETHYVDNIGTEEKCVSDLSACGYTCERITQTDYPLPLLKCVP